MCARHLLPAGRLKGPVQRQWQAGPVLTVVDPVFLSRLWCACGGSFTARPPAPDQPSLARGLGRGGCPAISLSLTLFRFRARPPAVEGTRTRMHTFSCSAPLPSTARVGQCHSPQWRRRSSRWQRLAIGGGRSVTAAGKRHKLIHATIVYLDARCPREVLAAKKHNLA